MPGVDASAPVKSVTIDAVLIKKDGTRHDLGTVAAYYRSPFKRLKARVRNVGKVRF